MNATHYRAKSIFLSAAEIASLDERRAFVEAACAGDVSLRGEVEELLLHQQSLENFLEAPAVAADMEHAPLFDEALMERPGATIGPYKLLEQIGEGGMGVVFMAEQTKPVKRRVALKIIKPGMDTRQVIARFEAERQALALMDHPNIAKVLDAGTTVAGSLREPSPPDDAPANCLAPRASQLAPSQCIEPPASSLQSPASRPFFVMELVHGVPITDYCDQCQLSTRERLELFVTVCQAVQHAHQKGVIHRDLKPNNVLVAIQDGKPAPKIIDFGVAKAIGDQSLTERTLTTAFAQMIGTPMYMSPEQADLSPLGVDTRSDIYSLGVMLYELLTGATPFDKQRIQEASYDELRRIIREEEPPKPSARLSSLSLRERAGVRATAETAANQAADLVTTIAEKRRTEPRRLRQTVRGELDWIVMKCLEKDRNRRYETPNSLARDVERYLHDEPVQACPPSAAYRFRKFVWRNKVAFFAVSVLAIAILVALLSLSVSNSRITRERDQKDIALKEKLDALDIAQAREREAKDQLFLSLLSQAKAHRQAGKMGQRVESLSALAQAARIRVDERLRDEAIAAMALPDVRLGTTWRFSIPEQELLEFDGHYERYIRLDDRGAVSVRSLADDREIQRLVPVSNQALASLSALRFSPDGRLVAASEAGGKLHVWRVADGQTILPDIPDITYAPAFSPDSRRMAIGQNESAVCYDLTTGKESARWQLPGRAYSMAFDPVGRRLAVTYFGSGIVSVYDAADGGKQLTEFSICEHSVGHSADQVVTWHPDGNRLAVSDCHNNDIQIWDVAAGTKLVTLAGHVQQVAGLSFHPDGALLVSASWDGVIRMWDVATGRPVMQIPMGLAGLQFSEDGRWLGVTIRGQQIQALEVVPTNVYRTWGAGMGGFQGNFSPDGRLLAVGFDDGARLWDVIAGRELARLPGPIASVFFHPTGHELFTCAPGGLNRWPIEERPEFPHDLHIGPAQPIPVPIVPQRADASADGRTIAVVSEAEGKAVTINFPGPDATNGESVREGLTLMHPGATIVALSRNGRWLATSGWHSTRVRLWDAHTGRMVHEWSPGERSHVVFTPDSRVLILCRGDEFSFWDLESLQPIRRIHRDVSLFPGQVGFSPDGRLMALEMAPGVIHLKDVATARTVARLEDPFGDRAAWIGFTPDGTQLAVVAPYARAVHTWDLRAIRVELKSMGLDWDWPAFSMLESPKVGSLPGEPILRIKGLDSTSPRQPPITDN
jgi:serine/threonine protein kinase/WD40 repeat protein